jgi:sulfide:quinone oxidoreductase
MSSPPARVVVLGAGVAGQEAALLLARRLSGRVTVHVVSASDEFLLRPNLVYVPFGTDPAVGRLRVDETLPRAEIEYETGAVDGVDTDAGHVHLVTGRTLPYEHLVIATGAASWPHAVPGLEQHAVSTWEPAGMLTLRERFLHIRGRAREGARQRVLFTVAQHNLNPLPLYEVALMLDTWLRRERVREHVELAFVTPEASFAEAAGPRMHEVIDSEFRERGVDGRASDRVVEVRPHEASFASGGAEQFDVLVAAPAHRAAVRLDGLPLDERGFVRVQHATRQVVDHPELYAPGDAGDFPLKDSFLALQQADAVANHITAIVRGDRFDRPFAPLSIQIVDMLDKAAFAQLELEATGDPDHPVRPRADRADDYKVGVSRGWRAARRMLSSYLLMQFAAAEPFRTGPGWHFMDFGVRAMAGMLSE